MSSKIMRFSERAAELNKLAKGFEKSFPSTSDWLKQLSEDMLRPKATPQEVIADWKDVMLAFKNEFVGSIENWQYRGRCYMALEKAIDDMMRKLGPNTKDAFDKILPELEIGSEAVTNLERIHRELVAAKSLSEAGRYYGLCFMYLVYVEGVYDEYIRLLYTFRKATDGVNIAFEAIKDKGVWELATDLDPVFSEGYNNRIRNAIAHAKFKYDDANKIMSFRDRATKNQHEYSKSLSLEEFGIQYYDKIDSFCRLVNFYFVLLVARDFAFAPRPLGRTTMKHPR